MAFFIFHLHRFGEHINLAIQLLPWMPHSWVQKALTRSKIHLEQGKADVLKPATQVYVILSLFCGIV